MKNKSIQNIYQDQCMVNVKLGDKRLFAPYTPYGIEQMDRQYSSCILLGIGTKEKLKQHIQDNAHLSQELKDNLILNLRHFGSGKNFNQKDKELLEKTISDKVLLSTISSYIYAEMKS